MRKFEYTPDEINACVYELHKVEKDYVNSKNQHNALESVEKDYLAKIMCKFDLPSEKISEAKLERLARDSVEWMKFKEGLSAAHDKMTLASVEFHHKRNCYDSLIEGMGYKRTLILKGVETL
jgi:hypothetical protein